jgi:hypothetical protein
MGLTPEYGEEELLGRDEAGVQRPSPPPPPGAIEEERELQDREREDRELFRLDPEDNELRAPGEVCARCGEVITAAQDVRLRPDGRFVHEVCPRLTARVAEE